MVEHQRDIRIKGMGHRVEIKGFYGLGHAGGHLGIHLPLDTAIVGRIRNPNLLDNHRYQEWVAIFARSTLTRETVSLVLRALASYLLGFFEWRLVCSVVGRESGDSGGATEEVGGQAVA